MKTPCNILTTHVEHNDDDAARARQAPWPAWMEENEVALRFQILGWSSAKDGIEEVRLEFKLVCDQ